MAFAARVALLCALLPALLAARPHAPNPAALLARMRAAAGPVWSTHFVSVSRLAVDGSTSLVESDGMGIPFRISHCIGELCQGTYFNGTRLYSVDINGTALPQETSSEPYLRALRTIASLTFLAPSFHSGGRRVDGGGTATIAGKRYARLFIVDPNAVSMEVFVDPHTALVRYARDVNGDDTFEYLDYRKVDGFQIPFEVRHNGNLLERYDDRTPVATAFVPPHGPTPTFNGPPAAVPTDPSLHIPVFTCSVDGIAARCLLDTGNSGLSLSSELASRLDAPVVGTFAVRGLGGYSTQVVRAGPLRIGNAKFPSAYYVVLHDIKRYGYDVVLGADILGNTSVALDASAHTLRFDASPHGTATSIPLTFANFVPVVNVQLGTLDAQLAIDTGDESNINLAHAFYAAHAHLFTVTHRRTVGGVGGSSVESIGSIPSVTIGGLRTGPQAIGTTATLRGTASGHLGAQFLAHFKVVLDYANGLLELVP